MVLAVPFAITSVVPALPSGVDGNPLPAVLFYLFAAMVVGSALMVAIARNIVRAATALLFTLAGMAGFYFLLHAEFLAAVQLVVYVGGTLILLIFGVMLTSKSPTARFDPTFGEVVWALIIGTLITVPLVILVAQVAWPMGAGTAAGEEAGAYSVRALGRALIDPEGFLAPFELVSVLLLAVMIGAAYLAKVRQPGRQ
jgi:NADH-quinone oxidoreductase subunit J